MKFNIFAWLLHFSNENGCQGAVFFFFESLKAEIKDDFNRLNCLTRRLLSVRP